jgi:preprotein translocase subunit SecA
MTGTANEVAREIGDVYRLPVVRVPTHRPLRRDVRSERIYATLKEKWSAELHEDGRAVLVSVRSVEVSELSSKLLSAHPLPHSVLNARQDAAEAEIVSDAGEQGRITVATNMAGRGTNITLDDAVRVRGGLVVIATERHEAARIDRQLMGRCARQGDPGRCERFSSLEDEIVAMYAPEWAHRLASALAGDPRGAQPRACGRCWCASPSDALSAITQLFARVCSGATRGSIRCSPSAENQSDVGEHYARRMRCDLPPSDRSSQIARIDFRSTIRKSRVEYGTPRISKTA